MCIRDRPIVTKSKSDTTHNRRLAFSALRSKEAVSELFREIAVKVGDRPGGYTRIIKLGNRLGDNADMAMIELVDFNEIYNSEEKAKKKTRRRGGAKAKSSALEAEAAKSETVVAKEEPKAEVAPQKEAAAPEVTNEEENPKEE